MVQVINITPTANDTNAPVADDIVITFSEDIDSSTVEDNIIVRGSQTGIIKGTFTVSNDEVTFNPTSDFKVGEEITVEVTSGVLGTNTQPATPRVEQFTVETEPGTGNFSDSSQSLGSSDSVGVSLGDVDGDGDLDAFVANLDEANKVWLNDGSGNFSDSSQSLGDSYSVGVSLGDVDGDGDLDAFVANLDGEANKVWLNNGSGNFSDSSQSLGDSDSVGVSLGDVDGDGDLDAFVANRYGANKVWLNNGSGKFSDSSQSLGSSYSRGVSLGDVDGDGDLDAFVANREANKVWLNDGSGKFSDSSQSLGSSFSSDVSLGDVDGDGDLDAFVANREANKVWLNDGSGKFSETTQFLGSSFSSDVSLGDVDGDGHLDAFVANFNQANKVWLNDGSGNFSETTQSLGSSTSFGVSLGDVNGDGDIDAFVVNFGENKVWLNENPLPPIEVTNITPTANDTNAPVADDIIITFSEDINESTVEDNIKVRGSQTGIIEGTFTVSNDEVTFNPTSDFKVGEQITVEVTSGVKATSGADTTAKIHQFTVEATSGFGNFTDSGNSLGSSNSLRVSLGDVDGDGHLDAFVANDGEANKVWLNDGSGNFSDSSQSLGSSNSLGVSLGDVDGDGHLDAFVANYFGGANKVWLNNGSGNFSETTQFLGFSSSRGVSLGDVNGDGDLDAFVANSGANKVWLNDGSGNFSETTQFLGFSSSRGVSLGDVDGDGDLDAFVANRYGANKVWLNDGSGKFSETTQSLGDSSSSGVSLGDVDGDGDLDAFVANNGANKVWLNDGSGNFSDSSQSLGSSNSLGVSLGDVDGDGHLDAFVANFNQANKVWLNDGSGNFSETTQSLGSSTSFGVSLGDVNGDGHLDAFVANIGENKVWLNENPLPPIEVTNITPTANDTKAPVADDIIITFSEDIDSSTVEDNIIVRGSQTGIIEGTFNTSVSEVTFNPTSDFKVGEEITVEVTSGVLGTNTQPATPRVEQFTVETEPGTGNFSDSSQSLGSSSSRDVSLGDVDGDGDLDAFVANIGENKVWLNDGSGNFTDSSQSLGSSSSRSVSLGDVNGDGHLDAFVAKNGGNEVWLNNGSGNFTQTTQSFGSSNSYGVDLGDVNGDGHLDAFVAKNGGNEVWLNNGSGDFTLTQTLGGNGRSNDVELGDVDGDGNLDAFVANSNGDTNEVWLNNGSGTFTLTQTLGDSSGYGVSLGDLDGDGSLDAFVANNGENEVWLNNGSGNFILTQTLNSSYNSSQAVSLGDVDSDGDIDAFVANSGEGPGAKEVWINDGNGNFTLTQTLSDSNGSGVSLGDLDSDGDIDAFVTNFSGQANKVWLNNNPPEITSSSTFSVAENSTKVGKVTATDAENDSLTYSISGGEDASLFTIDAQSGELSFKNAPDFETPSDDDKKNDYQVTVEVSDGNLTTTQAVTVTVTDENEPSTITSSSAFSVAENSITNLTITTTDVDGDNLTYSISGDDASFFDIDAQSGELSFKTAPDFETPSDDDKKNDYQITVEVSDGSETVTQDLTITVTDINEPPTITSNSTFSVAENTTTDLTITATDVDSENLSFNITGGADASLFTINNSGNLIFNTAPDFETPSDADEKNDYQVTVEVSDGTNTASQAVTVTVTDENEPPTITSNSAFSVTENSTTVGTITATDVDSDNLSFNITGGADASLFTINNSGNLIFNTAPDFETPSDADEKNDYQVTVEVSDGTNTASQAVTVTVTDENEPPTITSNSAFSVAENSTTVGTITTTDVDSDNLTYSISGDDASFFDIDAQSGELSFKTAPNFETPSDADKKNDYQITVEVSDGNPTVTQAVTVTVTDENEAPTITSSPTFSVAENSITDLTITATDVDGDNLTYSISGDDASFFDIDAQSGELSFKTAPNFETAADANADNNYQVQVAVSDGSETVTQDLTITVTDINEPPTITSNSTFSVAENTTTDLTITATDVDGNDLSFSISGGADQELFTINESGELSFKTAPDFETAADADADNNYQVQVAVSDGSETAVTQAVTVSVTDVNEAPTANDATFNVDENSDEGTQVGIINATEPENEALTFAITSGNLDPDNDSNLAFAIDPSTGTITVNDKDDLDFETTPSFNLEVTATDAVNLSDTAQVTINLNDLTSATFNTSESENGFFNLSSGENTNLKFTLNNIGSENANEVGVFVVDDENGTINGIAPGADGYLQAALQRAQVIFSTISELPEGFTLEDVERVLEVDSDTRLGFYLIPDGTTQTALSQLEETGTTDLPVLFSNSSNPQVSELSENGFNLNWSEVEGGSDFTAVELSVGLTDDTPAPFTELQRESQLELIDLRDVTGSVDVQVDVHREAAFDNLIGFYEVTDSDGGIDTTGDGIADVNVGDAGYKQAALENRITSLDLLGTDDGTSTTINGSFDGGGIIASFMIVDGTIEEALNDTKETYFSYLGANNGVDRIRLLGENTFGYEDLTDNDFDDVIVELKFPTV